MAKLKAFFFKGFALIGLGLGLPTLTLAQGVLIPHYLGQTQVTFTDKDRQALQLDKCPPNQTINNIRLRTVKGSIKVDSLQVRYADGKTDNLPVKETIQEDTDSRWIALSGSDRCVINISVRGSGAKSPKQPILVKIFGL
jgi:hypothetical protein